MAERQSGWRRAARSWPRRLRWAAQEFRADQVSIIASGVAFRATLAIFPGVAVLVWIGSRFIGFHDVQSALQSVSEALPASSRAIISQAVNSQLAGNPGAQGANTFLGPAASLLGLLFAIWSTNSGVEALFVALNAIFDRTERRGFLRLTLITLAFTAGAFVLAALVIGLILIGPYLLSLAGKPQDWLAVWRVLRWLVLFAVSAVALGLLYRYAPNRDEGERWPFVTVGGVAAALVVTGLSAAFSWFVATFAGLPFTYGSLSSVIAFMLWLWLSFIVVLAGAELDAAVERDNGKAADGGRRRRESVRGSGSKATAS